MMVVVQAKLLSFRRSLLVYFTVFGLLFAAQADLYSSRGTNIEWRLFLFAQGMIGITIALLLAMKASWERQVRRQTVWVVDLTGVHIFRKGRYIESVPWSDIDRLHYRHGKGRLMLRRRGTWRWTLIGPVSCDAYLRVEKLRAGVSARIPSLVH